MNVKKIKPLYVPEHCPICGAAILSLSYWMDRQQAETLHSEEVSYYCGCDIYFRFSSSCMEQISKCEIEIPIKSRGWFNQRSNSSSSFFF